MMKRYSILLILSCYSYLSYGQWHSDSTKNTVVCNAPSQQAYPKVCSDGTNGCFVVWQDSRHNGYGQIYIQKYDADGKAKWDSNGVRVCSTGFVQRGPIIASDGNGGAYVVWQDDRNPTTKPDLYSQHFLSDGSKTYGAFAKSIAKVVENSSDAGGQKNWTMIPDGLGNAYVAWEDSRLAITPESSRPDIYMTRLWPGGVRAPDTGVSVHNAPARQTEPYLIRDTLNRCFMAFSTNYTVAPYGIAVTQIDTSLNILWGGSGTPNVIYRNPNFTQNSARPRVVKYAGMYYMAWEELQSTGSAGWDILAQKLSNTGVPVWFLPATMTPSLSGDQVKATPNTDFAGGMQVIYENYQGNKNISSSRVLANGASTKPASPNHIYNVCDLTNDQRNPMAVPTEKGMLVFWEDTRKSADNASIFAQVIDTMPSRLYPVAGSRWGFPVSTDVGPTFSNKDQMDIAPRENGAIVVWRDSRNYNATNNDIYMQLVFKNSTLPIELADFRLTRQLANAVRIDWQTAMEKDNAGFEIERRLITGEVHDFEVIASYKNVSSLQGANSSSTLRNYSYLDIPSASGKYEYRLVDFSLDGERTSHAIKEIELGQSSATNDWVLVAASPNPFRGRTSVSFIAPRTAVVDLQVIDQLGRVVASPLKNSIVSNGAHTVAINASELGASGTYYYYLTARNAETGEVIFSAKPSVLNLIR
jgi:hypothetical protein